MQNLGKYFNNVDQDHYKVMTMIIQHS